MSPAYQSEQTRVNHPIMFRCWASDKDCRSILKQHRVNAGWRKVYSRPSVGLVLGQRRRRLTGIEPAMALRRWPNIEPVLCG